ncbi:MAG: IPT/TIG domain-containing protein [Deltaproteobacteria bacterium]|nr:IPT/TIG domain-containing protein [Deltaproteobacteria bacterium]
MPSIRTLTLIFLSLVAVAALPMAASAQPRPVIERIEPASGPVGIEIQLIGRQIHPQSQILLGDTVLPTVRRHPGRWVVSIPAGAQSGNITIRTGWGEFRGPYFRVTAGRPAPIVRSMAPTTGGPGTEVTLLGENFAPRLADNRVVLGNRPVVLRAATPTRLVVVIPGGATSGRFVIRVAHSGETQSEVFTVGAATRISDMTPRSGPPGTRITLIGTGFSRQRQNNRVYLNNRPLRVSRATETRIEAEIPARAASGTILVDVTNGGRAESPSPFVIQHTPAITSFEPVAVAPGRRVTITGSSFGRDPRHVTVTLGGRPVTLRRVTPNRIEVEIPAGAVSGRLAVTINGVGPIESHADLTVLSRVVISGFAPTSGATGTEVTIRGAGFSPTPAGNQVFVGRTPLEVIAASASALRVRMTATRSDAIRVRVPHNGEARSSAPFVITRPPVVASFTPTSGAPGTEVTIRGQRFGTNLSLVRVTMGGRPFEVRSVTDSAIIAVVPANAQSERIQVSVRLQGTGSSEGRFAIASRFTVSGLSPASTFVGSTVTIRGEGLVSGATVLFPGVRRPAPGTFAGGRLTVTVPARARTGALTVRLPDGRTATTPTFTVTPAPSGVAVTALQPRCYRPGCEILVRGHGFSPRANQNRVTFGDRPVQVVRSSAGELLMRLPAAPGTNRFHIDVRRGGEADSPAFTIVP